MNSVVIRCWGEYLSFFLSYPGYPSVRAPWGSGSLQAQSEHWHD